MSQIYNATFVWTSRIRIFHWVNVIAILLLIIIGTVILNAKTLGISVDGKILLKTIHVFAGYLFAVNLLFRITIGFIGKGFERWGETLPFNSGFVKDLSEFKQAKNKVYKGHNPIGKLMVAALLTFMIIQMISGLVIAGTDIYYPPFGQYFSESIAIDKSKVDLVKPYSKENVDEDAYKQMRAIRSPFAITHLYSFYVLIFLIPLHILGVIFGERKDRTSLVSSMINGYKYLPDEKKKE